MENMLYELEKNYLTSNEPSENSINLFNRKKKLKARKYELENEADSLYEQGKDIEELEYQVSEIDAELATI